MRGKLAAAAALLVMAAAREGAAQLTIRPVDARVPGDELGRPSIRRDQPGYVVVRATFQKGPARRGGFLGLRRQVTREYNVYAETGGQVIPVVIQNSSTDFLDASDLFIVAHDPARQSPRVSVSARTVSENALQAISPHLNTLGQGLQAAGLLIPQGRLVVTGASALSGVAREFLPEGGGADARRTFSVRDELGGRSVRVYLVGERRVVSRARLRDIQICTDAERSDRPYACVEDEDRWRGVDFLLLEYVPVDYTYFARELLTPGAGCAGIEDADVARATQYLAETTLLLPADVAAERGFTRLAAHLPRARAAADAALPDEYLAYRLESRQTPDAGGRAVQERRAALNACMDLLLDTRLTGQMAGQVRAALEADSILSSPAAPTGSAESESLLAALHRPLEPLCASGDSAFCMRMRQLVAQVEERLYTADYAGPIARLRAFPAQTSYSDAAAARAALAGGNSSCRRCADEARAAVAYFDSARVASAQTQPLTLAPGSSAPVQVETRNAAGQPVQRTVTWLPGQSTVAAIAPEGIITARAPGTATFAGRVDETVVQVSVTVASALAAQTVSDQTAQTTESALPAQTVEAAPPAESQPSTPAQAPLPPTDATAPLVVLSGGAPLASDTVRVAAGAEVQLAVQAPAADAAAAPAAVTWTSSDAAVASVDANGILRGVAPGTTTISVSAGTARRQITVQVLPPS